MQPELPVSTGSGHITCKSKVRSRSNGFCVAMSVVLTLFCELRLLDMLLITDGLEDNYTLGTEVQDTGGRSLALFFW
jgi:hypothetical protein